jgi:hypothetical protein
MVPQEATALFWQRHISQESPKRKIDAACAKTPHSGLDIQNDTSLEMIQCVQIVTKGNEYLRKQKLTNMSGLPIRKTLRIDCNALWNVLRKGNSTI